MTKMLIDRAVVEQALEALYEETAWFGPTPKGAAAITALRAALAEPVQEQRERELNEALTERDDAEDYIDALLDEVLGPNRAEWSSAYGRADALEEVRERIAQMLKPSIDKAWNRFEAALEQQAEPVQEPKPAAWRFEARHIDSAWAAAVTLKHPGPEGVYMRNVMPLYAHPPQRKPLTDEEIVALIHPIVMADMPDEMTDYEIARAIERAIKRAHKIGVQP